MNRGHHAQIGPVSSALHQNSHMVPSYDITQPKGDDREHPDTPMAIMKENTGVYNRLGAMKNPGAVHTGQTGSILRWAPNTPGAQTIQSAQFEGAG